MKLINYFVYNTAFTQITRSNKFTYLKQNVESYLLHIIIRSKTKVIPRPNN